MVATTLMEPAADSITAIPTKLRTWAGWLRIRACGRIPFGESLVARIEYDDRNCCARKRTTAGCERSTKIGAAVVARNRDCRGVLDHHGDRTPAGAQCHYPA